MKELTFREVIANIKEDEVWESLSKTSHIQKIISKKWGINFIFNCANKGDLGEIGVNNACRFKLKRNKVSFSEAFKAYEQGKEIESCVSGCKYRKDDKKEYYKEIYDDKWIKWFEFDEGYFQFNEIRGEWYIN